MIIRKRPCRFVHLLLACLAAAGLCLPLVGCGTTSQSVANPLSSIGSGFGSKSPDRAFKEQVEKDRFPTAEQVGLK
ncbi:MAG: hypothetical protein V3V75_03070 [Thermoguttaceae bacterium]